MSKSRRILRFAIVVVPIAAWLAAAVSVGARSKTNVTIKQTLISTGGDLDATGKATTSIRKISKRFGGLEARLRVEVRKLDQDVYDVSLDGVRIGPKGLQHRSEQGNWSPETVQGWADRLVAGEYRDFTKAFTRHLDSGSVATSWS